MKKTTIYYDADCPTCTVYMNSSQVTGLEWQPNTNSDSKNKDKEILATTADGETVGNIEVLALIESAKGNTRRATLLRNPWLQPVLRIGYRLVAHYRKYLTGPQSTFFWIKTLIGIGLLGASVASWRLWTSWHDFPAAPLLGRAGEWLFEYGSPVLGLVYLTALLGLIFTKKKTSFFVLILLGVSALLVIGDLNRLRPWLYEFLLLLSALLLFDTKKPNVIPASFLVILAGTYFWGGVHKLNSYFVHEIFPWFISPITGGNLGATPETALALFVVAVEVSIGALLLNKKTRLFAAILATPTHLFIVTVLPIGHHWGYVIFFWNLALLGIVWLSTKTTFVRGHSIALALAVILAWLLPVGNLFGIWDNYLSSALYAHETDHGYIVVSNASLAGLPEGAQTAVITWPHEPNTIAISTLMWSYDNYNTALYTNPRVYTAALSAVCQIDNTAKLYLRAQTRLFREKPGQIVTCDILQKRRR